MKISYSKMAHVTKMYFSTGFLYSLCFSGSIVKDKFTIDKFLTLKKLGFFTKKTNIGLRLIRYLDLWIENNHKKKKKKKKKNKKN